MMTTETRLFRASILNGDEEEDAYEVLESMAKDVGKGMLTSRFLRSWAMVEHLWVAKQEEKVLGFLLTCPLNTLDIWEWNQKLGEERIVVSEPILHLIDEVVSPFNQNAGIGTELARGIVEHEQYDVGRGYRMAVATSRVPTSGDTSGTSYNVLLRNGFTEVGRIPNFYSNCRGWTCPTCNSCQQEGITCNCDGRLMVWGRPTCLPPPGEELQRRD